ncbi:MAG: hypothetical protein ABW061_09560 [Polyangiaceae bacterium]
MDEPRTLELLSQRQEGLAQAFVAFEAYRTGQVERAKRARALLMKYEPGVDGHAASNRKTAFVGLRNCESYALGPDAVRKECVLRIASERAGLREWVIEKHPVPPATERLLRAARSQLVKALSDARANGKSLLYPWAPAVDREYFDASQRSWLTYRVAWSALLLQLESAPDSLARRARERALEALLTEARAADLDTDPAERPSQNN